MRFEPAGMTDDSDIRMATSLVDYVFRRLALDFLPLEQRIDLGVLSAKERTAQVAVDTIETITVPASAPDAPLCMTCGSNMQRAGSCYVCSSCGTTSGCS
jgi:ribonucleoside-diphosphate reductase alpha chain